jgi:8-oxo-dGTP pyrophosphatase MutT (NUDIX family)
MHRQPLLLLLDRYAAIHPGEGECVARMRRFVQEHADCLERSCVPGHMTASAWILSPDLQRFLMTHHKKLDRWLQLGGHADGEREMHLVALREAHEESGLLDFGVLATDEELVPFDLDVHEIPAREGEPGHLHYDVRFLLVARSEAVVASDESRALAWFPMDELEEVCREESLTRMGLKARGILAHM